MPRGKANIDPVGGPIPVRLIVRRKDGGEVDPQELAAAGNTLAGDLAVKADAGGAAEVDLALDTPRVVSKDVAAVEVSVDGLTRVVRYDLAGAELGPATGVAAPAVWLPGELLRVRVEDDAGGDDQQLEIHLAAEKATDGGDVRRLPSRRDRGIDLRVGPNGEAVFVTRSRDWVVEFPTRGLFGPRDVFVRGADGARKTVLFDATSPKVVPAVRPGPVRGPAGPAAAATPRRWYRPGETVEVSATIDTSRVDAAKGVRFYVGAAPAPDGKPTPGGQVADGTRQPGGSDSTTATYHLHGHLRPPGVGRRDQADRRGRHHQPGRVDLGRRNDHRL